MRVLKVFAFGLMLSAYLFSVQRAHAVVIAEDDFSGTGSGTGWESGNDWEGLGGGIVSTNPSGAENVESFRNFETPIDPVGQVTYIRFDYRDAVPGDGAGWGGAAFFEGFEGDPADETLFIGDSGGATNYASDLKQGDNLVSPIAIDDQFHTMILKVDATGADHIFELWVDNFNESVPSAATTVAGGGPIDSTWGTLRLASDGPVTNEFDNLIIATAATDVGLVPNDATLTIDRNTGNISLSSPTAVSDVVGYSLLSGSGSLNPAGWTTITDNYDNAAGPGDGSFDTDDDWSVTSAAGDTTDASEFVLSGDGGTLGASPVDLGSLWAKSPFEDVAGSIFIDDNGTLLPLGVNVVYTGTPIIAGDLDGDGDLDAADWASFKSGQGRVNDTMTIVQAYQMGDMNGDLDHSLTDFGLFAVAYNDANGVGAFAAMVQSIPEPGSVALFVAGLMGVCVCRRRRNVLRAFLSGIVLVSVCVNSQHAKAVVLAEDDFSAEGSGTGWAAGDDWGNVAGGVGNTAIANNAFRAFEDPFDPFWFGKVYIAFDFQIPTGNQWGGVAFFEDVDGGPETLFVGDTGVYDVYGIDLKGDAGLNPVDAIDGVPIDANFHRLIVEIDFDAGTKYSLWVDNFNQDMPTNSVTVDNSPIGLWSSVRLGGDGGTPLQVDNLIITDDASLVFTQQSLELVVNKATGDVSLQNNTGAAIDINAYSIGSATNMLDVGALAGDFDADGDVDGSDFLDWQRQFPALDAGDLADWDGNYGLTGSGGGGWESFEEQDLANFSAGDGTGNGWEEGGNPNPSQIEEYFLSGESTVGDGTSTSLGNAYGGGVAGDENLTFSYRSGDELKFGTVSYIGGIASATVAVPEPTSVAISAIGLCILTCLKRERQD